MQFFFDGRLLRSIVIQFTVEVINALLCKRHFRRRIAILPNLHVGNSFVILFFHGIGFSTYQQGFVCGEGCLYNVVVTCVGTRIYDLEVEKRVFTEYHFGDRSIVGCDLFECSATISPNTCGFACFVFRDCWVVCVPVGCGKRAVVQSPIRTGCIQQQVCPVTSIYIGIGLQVIIQRQTSEGSPITHY